MDIPELEQQLRREGFRRTYVWEDGPNVRYSEHTHQMETAHIVLAGDMTLTMGGRSVTYHVGERCDVAAGALHAASMGPTGCRYLIGEK